MDRFLDYLKAKPTTCDNCGRSLDRGSSYYSHECQYQALPEGETHNGRGYIVVCAYGECLPRKEQTK